MFVDEIREAIREKHGDSVVFRARKPYGFSAWLKMDSTALGSSRIIRLVQKSEGARPRLLLAASANGGEPRVDRMFQGDVRECLRLFERELEKVEARFAGVR